MAGANTLDWNHLKYVLALGRAGTMSGAGKLLKVDHTTVGRHVSAVEDTLEEPLFKRQSARMVPTEAGADVIRAAERMEGAIIELDRALSCRADTPAGVVRVTTSEAFASSIIRTLASLRKTHPELRVEVLAGNRVLDIARGEADIAVRMKAPDQGSLIARKVLEMGWGLYASQEYIDVSGQPADTHALAEHAIIGFEDALALAPGAVWLREHGCDKAVVMRGDSILALREAAISGMGLAPLPTFIGEPHEGLVRVLPDTVLGAGGCWLVSHADTRNVPRIRVVLDHLAEALSADAERFAGR